MNEGEAEAAGVQLRVEGSQRVQMVSVEADQGTCSLADSRVQCDLGDLAPEESRTATVYTAGQRTGRHFRES